MKMNKKAVVAAAVFSAAMNLSACAYGPPYDPSDNRNADVYGPPEYVEAAGTETNIEDSSYDTVSENNTTEEASQDE